MQNVNAHAFTDQPIARAPGTPRIGGERLMLGAVSSGLKTDAERAERREVDAKQANRVEEDLEAFRNVLERFLANTA